MEGWREERKGGNEEGWRKCWRGGERTWKVETRKEVRKCWRVGERTWKEETRKDGGRFGGLERGKGRRKRGRR